ncbi:DUF6119 family protein [Gilvimarinus algae]|uniref:TIGR04141 family sporadically distributed protein n=1 Tax=Gilvimarinus algae TaxID=3058037 RepID=A0ABT8TFK6_9GAMM|nr:DUF6119 family protein [Gilvimarinus sp. SDUM040014]MDO3382420.1 TIGR04141 family sporadically distributed protein [Gilvimarinus sp. SDUM040014]
MDLGKITLYLSKEKKTLEEVIDNSKLPNESARFVVKDFSYKERSCRFYCRQISGGTTDNPPWLNFVNSGIGDANPINFSSTYTRPTGLLLVEWGERIVAASFGLQAGSWLKKYLFEPDFGVKVAMNLCGNKKVRQAKSSIQLATTQMIDRQLSRPSEAFDFGMGETEFLQYISAHFLANEKITLQGKDCLTIKLAGDDKLSWDTLFDFIEQFLDAFSKETYKELFPNYPNLTPVSNEKIEDLDNKLLSFIAGKEFDKFHLSIPEFIPDDEYSFTYRHGRGMKKINVHSHVDAKHIVEEKLFRNLEDVSIQSLNNKKIYAYSHEESKIVEGRYWKLYDCIVTEIEDEGSCYTLSAGVWRKVDDDFYNAVNNFVKGISEEDIPKQYHDIPIFCMESKRNKEAVFNSEYCKKDDKSILFDQSKLKIGKGRADKEFCDILKLDNRKGEIIHVKRLGGSSAVNHLFSQARFYCEFFLTDETFVQEIRNHITDSKHALKSEFLAHVKENLSDVCGQDYIVRLWILYDNKLKEIPKLESLPLMAKYELKLTYEKLRNALKYSDITFSMIPVMLTGHKEEIRTDTARK